MTEKVESSECMKNIEMVTGLGPRWSGQPDTGSKGSEDQRKMAMEKISRVVRAKRRNSKRGKELKVENSETTLNTQD